MTKTSIEYRFDHETAKQLEALLRFDLKANDYYVIVARDNTSRFVINKGGAKELNSDEFLYIKDFAEENYLDFCERVMSPIASGGTTRYYYHLSNRDQSL